MDLVLGERLGADGAKRVEPDVKRDALEVQAREQLRREMEPGRRRGSRPSLRGVDRRLALGILERLGDVQR